MCTLSTAGCVITVFLSASPDSLADSLEQPPAQTDRQNGGHVDEAREGKEKEAKTTKASQEDSSTAGPSRAREEGGERSQHKVQVRDFHTFIHKHIVVP